LDPVEDDFFFLEVDSAWLLWLSSLLAELLWSSSLAWLLDEDDWLMSSELLEELADSFLLFLLLDLDLA
jgi:hypothetical protein